MTGLRQAWVRFWFEPESTAALGLFRIAYGLVLTLWTLSLLPDAVAFYSSEGVVSVAQTSGWQWSVLAVADAPWVVMALVGILVAAAVCITVGYRTRLVTVVAFLILVSLRWRNGWIQNGGDHLLRHLGFYLMLAPAGAALSVDRWRAARDRFWEHPRRAPWALRLVQVQVSVVYLFTVWLKVQGERWNDGTAVNESLRLGDVARFELPWQLTDSLLAANLLTYGTLAVELALAVLIWNRAARPYVIGLGVVLHLFIEVTMALGFFSLVMIMAYVAFTTPEAAERAAGRVPHRLSRSKAPWLRRLGTGDSGAEPVAARGPDETSERPEPVGTGAS